MNDLPLLCGQCLAEVAKLEPPSCAERPETRGGGMYHCPDCGILLVAGVPHPWVCAKCAKEIEP